MAGKLKKKDVEYGPGMPHCGVCTHYIEEKGEEETGGCKLVEGAIDEDYYCRLYKEKGRRTLAGGRGG